jgi:hypothetical protein
MKGETGRKEDGSARRGEAGVIASGGETWGEDEAIGGDLCLSFGELGCSDRNLL